MNLKPSARRLTALRHKHHKDCVICGSANTGGLGLRCRVQRDGGVAAFFTGSRLLQGYDGWLHGGVIAALLDSAMTHCLFAHGCPAPTAELQVRYSHPVRAGRRMRVSARIVQSKHPLHVLAAELCQDGQVKARASGKFVAKSLSGLKT
ncbi:MAG: PaaI family thioesterase [Verrucomicrobiae bacterium]|nr:PaaI family thioesterase [Verrucomicrobiae bacterium]